MEPLRVSKSVRYVIALRKDADGHIVPVTLYRRRSRRRGSKGSSLFRPAEKFARRYAAAQRAAADSYIARHNRSNEKKKDGWVRDFNYNVAKAAERGRKQLKFRRLTSW
jgi:hypothetical protein